jgi:hypothetical protein
MILKGKHTTYERGLELCLLSLTGKREHLCLNLAKTCINSEKLKHMFPKNEKSHQNGDNKWRSFQG